VFVLGYEELAKLLIENGANVNSRNFNGATALIFAASFGRTAIATLLLECGADPSIKDDSGNMAMDHAKMQGISEIVKLLESVA